MSQQNNQNSELQNIRHSAEHVLTLAMNRLYPNKFLPAMGPATDDGFYFDFDSIGDFKISENDFETIEKEMAKIIKENLPIVKEEINLEQAKKIFANNPYKMEWFESITNRDEVITTYTIGEFVDLCAGPHARYTSKIKAFKLLSIAGAYWHGDEKNKMLTRIYGTAFESKEELEKYLNNIEEAKKRDHKKLGKELEIFMISEYGQGFPFFLPKGMILRNQLENFWYEQHIKEGYQFIKTPIMLNQELWQVSGHWENYRENMYISQIDDNLFAIKPMNCPGGMLVYKNSMHSYKDLPIRCGELGQVHRHEASGTLNGLFRVRTFTQDDAHIYMREDQIESEIIQLISFVDKVYKVFGLTYEIELSTRPEKKYIGTIKSWNKSEKILQDACKKAGKDCKINPGDGAFYGPKLDFHIKDSLGRVWQCGTIQLDANLPERFDLEYTDSDGSKKRPIMLHRVIFGSIERFIGILIEHFAGAFPTWLSPTQVKIIPITDGQLEYAQKIEKELKENNIRVEIDSKSETMQNKIRNAAGEKVPYMIIIGGREAENQTISVRQRDGQDLGTMSLADFVSKIKEQITSKSITLIK
ncbi:MAG: threonine--tRNA ligase [Candidatus Shapirobacteria bacterium]|nr:threonine--tRNA ligase [Candidatus Shapirobacteria bacterium]